MALKTPLLPVSNPSSDAIPAPADNALTGADIRRLQHSLDSSVSENTRKMYASAWRSFQAWTQARGNLSLPASPQVAAAYLAHLAEDRGAVSGHHPPAQGRPGRRPQDPRPRRPHRPRGSPESHEGNRPLPRPLPEIGQTPHRRGPRRRQGHREHQAPPGRRQEAGIGRKSLLARQGGPRPALSSP